MNILGPVLVVLAAMLWGTDGLWRVGLLSTLPSTAIVFWEHVVLVLVMGWIVWRERALISKLRRDQWVLVLLIGVGASALATILFTQAFRYSNPTTVILLQKTQPLIAITLAALWLREPLPPRFWPLLPFAMIGTYLISFGDTGPLASIGSVAAQPLGPLMAIGAAVLWGAGTALGRRLLGQIPFVTLVALRFTVALPALAIFAAAAGWGVPTVAQVPSLLMLALVAGLLGMLLYYRGLRETPAAVATLCELSFPITAIIVNFLFLGAGITPNQIVGTVVLWGSIALMQHRPVPPGVRVASPASA